MAKKEKNWIIVEDSPIRAEELITQIILQHGSKENIYWIYAHNDNKPAPTFIRDLSIREASFKRTVKGGEELVGNVQLYWARDSESFIEKFDKIKHKPGILLLDIELSALGGTEGDLLYEKARSFIPLPMSQKDALVCVVSRVAAYGPVKERIRPDDERIITDGAGKWVFSSNKMEENCREVIQVCDKAWTKMYEGTKISLADFLNLMSQLKAEDCHNLQEQLAGKKEEYLDKGNWSKEWDMPIQLQHLIQLIGWPSDKFIETFNLKGSNGFVQQHPICECLKTMGNADADSISVLGATVLAWAAHRELFPDGPKDTDFIEQILKIVEAKNTDTARYHLLTPPQTNETLQKTVATLYALFKAVFVSTRGEDEGENILKTITLDDKGLSLGIDIPPSPLMRAVSDLYREKHLDENASSNTAHGTSSAILNYLCFSNYSDKYVGNPDATMLGSDYSLKIIPKNENTTIIRLGYGTARHHLY